ncbi:MAG: hypothetical protein ACRDM7_02220 [Thermoleophilaceae bacterium]
MVLIAAVTLALAVAATLLTDDDGGSAGRPAQPIGQASPPPGRAGVLTPRVTEMPARPSPVPAGARYDGGPEEGSWVAGERPGWTDLSRPHYDGRDLVPGR